MPSNIEICIELLKKVQDESERLRRYNEEKQGRYDYKFYEVCGKPKASHIKNTCMLVRRLLKEEYI